MATLLNISEPCREGPNRWKSKERVNLGGSVSSALCHFSLFTLQPQIFRLNIHPMKLESQIDKLAELGLALNAGITIDDLLISWSREEYEDNPFNTILFTYGIEVEEETEGRFFCDRVWNFDAECICENGDYAAIVQQFHRISGRRKSLTNLSDEVDLEAGKTCLRYTLDGHPRELHPQISDDWVDPHVVAVIMEDMRDEGYDFYGMDNGQATVWFYMTAQHAKTLNALANNVFGLTKKPWWKFW